MTLWGGASCVLSDVETALISSPRPVASLFLLPVVITNNAPRHCQGSPMMLMVQNDALDPSFLDFNS